MIHSSYVRLTDGDGHASFPTRVSSGNRRSTMKSSKFLLAVAAMGAMLVGLAGTARAQRWDACSARVEKDQQDLDRAIDRFGYNSRQAQHERAELQRDAANCGYRDGRYDGDRDGWRYDNDGEYDQGYRDYNNSAFDNGY